MDAVRYVYWQDGGMWLGYHILKRLKD